MGSQLEAQIAEKLARGEATAHLEHALDLEAGLASGDINRIRRAEQRAGRRFIGTVGSASWTKTSKSHCVTLPRIQVPVARPRGRHDSGRRARSGASSRGDPDSDEPGPPKRRLNSRDEITQWLAERKAALDQLIAGDQLSQARDQLAFDVEAAA